MNRVVAAKVRNRVIVVLIMIIGITLISDFQLRPIIKTVSANKAQVISTNAINEAVIEEMSKEGTDYYSLVCMERAQDGKILAVTTNTRCINQLKARISIAIQEKLSQVGIRQINVPVGTLIGIELFNGRGPSVPLKISLSGGVSTEFTSSFSQAGINQTKHQIYLNVHTRISALVPGYPVTTDVSTNMSIAETIIVGEVPHVFVGAGIGAACEASELEHIGG